MRKQLCLPALGAGQRDVLLQRQSRRREVAMWMPEEHSDDENLRWAWLRAIEWRHWPLFISQPVVPVLLFIWPLQWVIGAVAFATLAWWFAVAPHSTPSAWISRSVYFARLKIVISPPMAYLIWQNGEHWTAALALLWPIAGVSAVSWLLMIPQAILSFTESARAAQIGVIQERLMARLGYVRIPGVGYLRDDLEGAMDESGEIREP